MSPLTSNATAQSALTTAVKLVQLLQGIGAGAAVAESGEKSLFSDIPPVNQANRPICIFDVGANQGEFVALALRRLSGRDFHIHCFEPGAKAFDALRRRINNDARATLNNVALGKEPGEAELFYDVEGSALASLTKRKLEYLDMAKSEKVTVETVDNYCAAQRIEKIDLLKIDVEGHELDVLLGATRMLKDGAIRMLTFEFGGCNTDTRVFFKDFFHLLTANRMKIARITPSGYRAVIERYHEVHEQFRVTNFVAYL
jgi:FkbM family methyltransferase